MMERLFIQVLNMSITASFVILAVIAVRFFLKRLPKIFSYVLWSAVLFRLLCPVSFSTDISLLRVLPFMSFQGGQISYIPESLSLTEEPVSVPPYSPTAEEAGSDSVNLHTADRHQKETGRISDRAAAFFEGILDNSFSGLGSGLSASSVFPRSVLSLGAVLWAAGVFLMAASGLMSYRKLQKNLAAARQTFLCGDSSAARHEQGRIYLVPSLPTPFVCGFLRPRIYLPESVDQDRQPYILLHEQIHIRRGDHIFRAAGYAALCIHWFNPLVWLAFSLSEQDMEMSCDEAVIRSMGSNVKKSYSASLLSLACHGQPAFRFPPAFGEGETGSRIKNILRYKRPAAVVSAIAALLCLLASFSLMGNPGSSSGTGVGGSSSGSQDTSGIHPLDSDGQEEKHTFYGVIAYEDAEGAFPDLVVVIPPYGEMVIPEARRIEPYIEIDFEQLQPGDLVKITFPRDQPVLIQETYPSAFSAPAESILIMRQNFGIRRSDRGTYQVAIPSGLAPECQAGDLLEIYWADPDASEDGGVKLADTVVLGTDPEHNQISVELSSDQLQLFLKALCSDSVVSILRSSNNRASSSFAVFKSLYP